MSVLTYEKIANRDRVPLNEIVGAEGEEPQGHGELDKEQDVVGDIVEAAAVDLQDEGLSAALQ